MTGPRPAGLPWTRGEDDQLRAMFEAGMKSPAIALKLRRTADAVRTRKTVLNNAKRGWRRRGNETREFCSKSIPGGPDISFVSPCDFHLVVQLA
jgi:hypothetical protein